jgi:hypothetical protein
MVSESDGGEIEYCDDDLLAEMDNDDGPPEESDDDFKTMNESDISGDQMDYDEG